jgi:bacillithiol biosynthesis cysteine-adding enzyme BshC
MLPVNFEDLSGSTSIFLDFIGCRGSACDFYKYDFKKMSAYRTAAGQIDKRSYPREQLVSSILKGLEDIGYSPATEENIRKLSRPDSLVVFAGQQVGMLLGPMFTVIKALSSYKMAAKLESKLGRPVVPCFWMATDDHDFDEVRTVRHLNRSGECLEISFEPELLPAGAPMSDIRLDDTISDFLGRFEENLLETEFSQDIKRMVHDSYVSGRGISEAFADLFGKLFGEFGIVPVSPNFPGIKRMMIPVFKSEIENHEEIFRIFEDRSQEILRTGYHRQVHKTGANLNLFINDGGRRNLVAEARGFHLDGKDRYYSDQNLLSELNESPDRFSPNVCLRPVAQCGIFPTVSQITGPSESAYFAQIQPIFEFMDVPLPVIRPRIFATLAEPHISRIFRKLPIDFKSLYNDTDHEVGRVIMEKFPPEIQNRAESLRPELNKPLVDLAESLKESEPDGYLAIESTRKRIEHELNQLSRKLLSVHKKRHETVREQIYRAANFLFPNGNFQERSITPVYFANKFGPDIFKDLEQKLDVDSIDHQVVEI